MSAGAVIMIRQRQWIRVFHLAGALSESSARPLADLHVRRSWIFDRMAARGIFLRTLDDRWYMDASAAEMFLARRRRWALGFAAVLLATFLAVLFLMQGA